MHIVEAYTVVTFSRGEHNDKTIRVVVSLSGASFDKFDNHKFELFPSEIEFIADLQKVFRSRKDHFKTSNDKKGG